jgi:Ser/Thr protein kinase RdoA (MazF antagonist)
MDQGSGFFNLSPDKVLAAAEQAGFHPTGEFSQLNSYENRVFDIVCEDGQRVISKFYRPQRWSKEAIVDEHDFLFELKKEGIPAVAPLILKNNSTLIQCDDMWTSFFPKIRGRLPQELLDNDYVKVGHLMAQVHNIGAQKVAKHRVSLDENFPGAWTALDFLQDWIAGEMLARYNAAAEIILETFSDTIDPREFIRIHGDCHRGNLLHDGERFFLVDFDDFVNGPVVQDFWMLFSGDKDQESRERELIIKGYEELREFPDHQWPWIPLLQGVRIISYAAWIAKRWSDPSFPRIFPEFNTYSYWAIETEALEKIAWGLELLDL